MKYDMLSQDGNKSLRLQNWMVLTTKFHQNTGRNGDRLEY